MENIASFQAYQQRTENFLHKCMFRVPYTKVRDMLIFFSRNSLHNGCKIACSLSSPVAGLFFIPRKYYYGVRSQSGRQWEFYLLFRGANSFGNNIYCPSKCPYCVFKCCFRSFFLCASITVCFLRRSVHVYNFIKWRRKRSEPAII